MAVRWPSQTPVIVRSVNDDQMTTQTGSDELAPKMDLSAALERELAWLEQVELALDSYYPEQFPPARLTEA
jgi:hypothetical protein